MGANTSIEQREKLDNQLIDLFQGEKLTPALWFYLRKKYINVCALGKITKSQINQNVKKQTFTWIHPLSNDLNVNLIKAAMDDGYIVAYPPLENNWEETFRITAKKNLINYISSLSDGIKTKKIDMVDKQTLDDAIIHINMWLDKNPNADINDIEEQGDILEKIANPIIFKVYHGQSGIPIRKFFSPSTEVQRGGILFVQKGFTSNLLDCSMNVKNDIFWYNVGSVGFGENHTQALLFNKSRKQFEFYDSNGSADFENGSDIENVMFGTTHKRIITALTIYFKSLAKDSKFQNIIDVNQPLIPIEETCPRLGGPQKFQDQILREFRRNPKLTPYMSDIEIGGYCQIWSLMILDARLANPKMSPDEVIKHVSSVPNVESGVEKGALLNQKAKKFLFDAFQFLDQEGYFNQ
jgi:hypothetical protein